MTIASEMRKLAYNFLAVYEAIHDLSDEIDDSNGDKLKIILMDLMDEIQKIYPVDY